jgi:bifunctional UDP-N-acetylglucosamine pyrophosphorylase/glucosamine-1-phosphate N-acetyltransferase
VGRGSRIEPYTLIDEAKIGARCRVGPYARIRPGTQLAADVHIGNFVEVKASRIAARSKANHLAYVGDTSVGRDVNIGAGTITCNYDGANKNRTVIEDDVHIGSDVQLVAPVTVAKGATIGAGTTVWKDTLPGGLVLNPKVQEQRGGWMRPQKTRSSKR